MKKKLMLILTGIMIMIIAIGCTNENITNENVKDIDEGNDKEVIVEENANDEVALDNEGDEEKDMQDEEIEEGIFIGDRAFDFTLNDREGNEISLSQFEGKAVFVNFWASWCPPCVEEMPAIQSVYEKYKDKDVVVLAVNVTVVEENGVEDTNKFLEEGEYTLPVLLDTKGSAATKYGIRYFPTSYFINKDRIIVDAYVGGMTEEMMIERIEKALEN